MAWIYVIGCGRRMVKVGKADNIRARMAQLQTAAPLRLELLYSFQISDTHVRRLEKRLHRRLKAWHSHGEWFTIARVVAVRLVRRYANSFARELLQAAADCAETMEAVVQCEMCKRRAPVTIRVNVKPAFRCSKCGSTLVAYRV